eukprot:6463649-Amphidinium_carterae.2
MTFQCSAPFPIPYRSWTLSRARRRMVHHALARRTRDRKNLTKHTHTHPHRTRDAFKRTGGEPVDEEEEEVTEVRRHETTKDVTITVFKKERRG